MSAPPVLSSTDRLDARGRPRRAVGLRIGLILAAVISVLNAIPAVAEIGFDGSYWDVIVVVMAVGCPAIALATIVLVPFGWHGARRPAVAVAVLQLVGIVGLLPPFFLVFLDGLPLIAPISAGITIALELLAVALILRGMQAPVLR